MKPILRQFLIESRWHFVAIGICIAVIIGVVEFGPRINAQTDKSIAVADKKPETAAVNISTSDLIKLNAALSLQIDAYNRREKAVADIYAAETDLRKAKAEINEVGSKLPKDAQAVQEDGRITGFTQPVRPATKP